jgi:dinuclear metal center YbgI/SA1388 family protein
MTKIKDILDYLESWAPLALQEDYDNSGLITGNGENEVKGIIIALDCTEQVVEEAIHKGCNLVVAHHPIVFRGLKRLTGKSYIERTVIRAIKNDIAIYGLHTNLDHVATGVNSKIAAQLGLINTRILRPRRDTLAKLTTFIPTSDTERVMEALHAAGAGMIGNYRNCSFRVAGTGTFLPSEDANPTIGKVGKLEKVLEDRVEVIFPSHLKSKILASLVKAHPYEEVAYYLHDLSNTDNETGSGMIGELEAPMHVAHFLDMLKKKLRVTVIRHTAPVKETIRKIALCGGSGSFLLPDAITRGADVFISGDFKYHEFFDAENQLMVADIGHYESEQFTKELIYDKLVEKFTNIALHFTEVNTNPIKYA